MNIVKFGGSVITSKKYDQFFNKDAVQQIADELPNHGQQSVLVHGTGLVGKPPAEKYGYLKSGYLPQESNLTSLEIKYSLRRLNLQFLETLLESSVNAIPIDTASFFNEDIDDIRDDERVVWLKMLLAQGLTPVFFGDMIPLAEGGFKVFSSDIISLILCKYLKPDKMLYLSNVDGVLCDGEHGDGSIIETLSSKKASEIPESFSDANDVSGGMQKKIECALEISRHCRACFIGSGLKPGIVSGFLSGKKVRGTLVKG